MTSGELFPVMIELPPEVGSICRCMVRCCKPGLGHNHPKFVEYERLLREVEDGRRGGASAE